MTSLEIPRVSGTSPDSFRETFVRAGRPVIVEGQLATWPALSSWTPDALADRLTGAMVPVVVSDLTAAPGDRDTEGGGRRHVGMRSLNLPFATCVQGVQRNFAALDPGVYAIPGYPVRRLPAFIADDIPTPAIVGAIPSAVPYFWLGPAGKIVPLHRDQSDGLLAQVLGRKDIALISPDATDRIYPFDDNPYLSRVGGLDQADLDCFPALAGVEAMRGTLRPGEMLFIPEGWWHCVTYRDTAISINYWPSDYLESLK